MNTDTAAIFWVSSVSICVHLWRKFLVTAQWPLQFSLARQGLLSVLSRSEARRFVSLRFAPPSVTSMMLDEVYNIINNVVHYERHISRIVNSGGRAVRNGNLA